MKLTFLGTLCELSFPRKDCDCSQCKEAKKLGEDYSHRYHSSLLIEEGSKKILIDVGASLKDKIKEIKPDHVLLTHAHPDHVGGLTNLEPACDIFLTKETLREVGKKYFKSGRKFTIIKPNVPFRVEGIKFVAHRVYHSTLAPSISFKIDDKILYAPDCLGFYNEKILDGVECYICDGSSLERDIRRPQNVGHLSIKNSINLAKKHGINYVIATHIGHVRLTEEDFEKRLNEIAEEAGIDQVKVAKDGMKLEEFEEVEKILIDEIAEGIRPAFGSPGGKRYLAKKIVSYIPEHKTYVEPFIGGGAVFFAKKPSEVEVINDLDSEIAFAYRFIKKITPENIDNLRKRKLTHDRNLFFKLRESSPKDELDRFYKFLYLVSFSVGNNRKTTVETSEGIATKTLEHKLDRIEKIKERLKNTKIGNKDFKELLQSYDSKQTFFYLDPPYPEQQGDLKTTLQVKDLELAIEKLKGNWILSMPKKEQAFKLAKKYNYKIFKVQRTFNQNTGELHYDTELLISNFPLKKINLYLAESAELEEFKLERYDVKQPTNIQLRDDMRLCFAKISTMIDGGKTEFKDLDEAKDFAEKVLKELLERDCITFHPDEMKSRSLEVLRELLGKLISRGLYLVPDHGKMIYEGTKKIIIKSKKFDLSEFFILCSGDKAYGFIRLDEPEEIDLEEFKKLEKKHKITEKERLEWWPKAEKLFSYSIRDFIPFEEPKPFKLPKGAQVIVDKVKLTETLDPRKIEPKKLDKLTNEELVKLHAELHRLFEKEI